MSERASGLSEKTKIAHSVNGIEFTCPTLSIHTTRQSHSKIQIHFSFTYSHLLLHVHHGSSVETKNGASLRSMASTRGCSATGLRTCSKTCSCGMEDVKPSAERARHVSARVARRSRRRSGWRSTAKPVACASDAMVVVNPVPTFTLAPTSSKGARADRFDMHAITTARATSVTCTKSRVCDPSP